MEQIQLIKVGDTILDEDLKTIEQYYAENKFIGTLKPVGSGAFGTVFKYTSLNNKVYAIKVGKKSLGWSSTVQSHDIEILLHLKGLECFTQIHAYDDFSLPNHFIMVVDFVDGVTVCQYQWDYNFDLSKNFVQGFKTSLKTLSSKKVRIKDLHNDNIMIDRNSGLPIIVDYGYFTISNNDDEDLMNSYGYTDSLYRIQNVYSAYRRNKNTVA